MAKVHFDLGEVVLAELSPSRRSVIFPVLELILATGIVWLLIGLLDAHLADEAVRVVGHVPDNLAVVPGLDGVAGTTSAALWGRRLLLLVWVWAAWRRCLRHLVFRQRSRIILTDRRLVTASGDWRSRVLDIPLDQVTEVRQRGGTVSVWTRGSRVPVRLTDVPYAADVAAMVDERIVRFARPVY
ncbi:PH domain-containing protein [uncultured Corynebacterium sp.]|uniref:PH domain-containing protein n=1 Tax=uncultured Corynebacterium sp. TaxID=159447 RepID=UPI0025E28328|nr:PH domain-containing protein [uncultured Corynebacterium sp.]